MTSRKEITLTGDHVSRMAATLTLLTFTSTFVTEVLNWGTAANTWRGSVLKETAEETHHPGERSARHPRKTSNVQLYIKGGYRQQGLSRKLRGVLRNFIETWSINQAIGIFFFFWSGQEKTLGWGRESPGGKSGGPEGNVPSGAKVATGGNFRGGWCFSRGILVPESNKVFFSKSLALQEHLSKVISFTNTGHESILLLFKSY